MNGIINVLKPTGMTSHDVVSRIRRIISQKKLDMQALLIQMRQEYCLYAPARVPSSPITSWHLTRNMSSM